MNKNLKKIFNRSLIITKLIYMFYKFKIINIKLNNNLKTNLLNLKRSLYVNNI